VFIIVLSIIAIKADKLSLKATCRKHLFSCEKEFRLGARPCAIVYITQKEMLPNLSRKVADRIPSSQAMTPTSGATLNPDSCPASNFGCLTCLASPAFFDYNDLRSDMNLKENNMKALLFASLIFFVRADDREG
jgi:hypothetical protein